MKILDPAFEPAPERVLVQRLKDQEAKMETLMAARSVSARVVAAIAPGPSASPSPRPGLPALPASLQPVSITGDFQASADTETGSRSPGTWTSM